MNTGRTLGIIGTGLIGSSIALRARELGWRVVGYDSDPHVSARAADVGALDACVSRDAVYDSCDTVVLAMHTRGTLQELELVRALRQPRASLILDVASVKAPVSYAARGIANFVATHPMAGAEKSGPDAARSSLFSGKPWLYVEPDDDGLEARTVAFITALGANPVRVDAAVHDATVALTSHVPQLLGTLFAERVEASGGVEQLDAFCGPTARELLRLSRSGAAMWRDILETNNVNIATELREFARSLLETATDLERGTLRSS